MSKKLFRVELRNLGKNTKTRGVKTTCGENRNTPASVSRWLDITLAHTLQNDASLMTGAATDRLEVQEYHRHVGSLKAAVKSGNWRAAISAAWLPSAPALSPCSRQTCSADGEPARLSGYTSSGTNLLELVGAVSS